MAINNIYSPLRATMADAFVDALDQAAGSPSAGNGTIEIWTAAFATLLGTLTFANPAFGNASPTAATANTITDDTSADATGTAAVCRFRDCSTSPNTIWEGTCGTSGADINFNTVSITSGDTISITSMTITFPAAATTP